MSQRIALTSAVLFAITVVVAATGYLRELVLARTFGAGIEMDAFYFSLGLIQAVHDLLFGATLIATIVPLLHRRESDVTGVGADPARFTVTIVLVIGLCASALAIALRMAMPALLDVLAPKMPPAVRVECLALSTVLVWLLPLNALTNVCVLVLNAHRRFILAGSAYLFINLTFVSVLLLVKPPAGANSLSMASVAGPLVLLPILGTSLARLGLLRLVRPDFSKKFFAPIWRQARPILLTCGIGGSLGLLMIAHLFVRSFAANSGEGSVAALGYAFRLYEVPLSLIANPAAVLMLPNIAIMYKAGNLAEIAKVSREILLAGIVVLFPAAVVTWITADFVVHVLLERGNFGPEAAQLTATALRGFAPAIVGEGIIVVFYRLFYAMHRPSRTVIVSCAALAALALLLVAFGSTSFLAVPLALSGGFLTGAAVLVYFLVREVGLDSLPGLSALLRWVGCALIGVVVWKFVGLDRPKSPADELLTAAAFTAVYGAAVLLVFGDYRRFLTTLLLSFTLR